MNPSGQAIQSFPPPLALKLAGKPSPVVQGNVPIDAPPDPNQLRAQNDQFASRVLSGILSTGGAIGGDLLAGPLGGAAGASGGQFLSNLITGQKPSQDVASQALFAGAGGLAGRLIPKVLGGVLSGAGDNLATGGLNLTKSMANKLAQTNGEPVLHTLMKNNLAGVNAGKLDEALSGLYEQQGNIAKQLPLQYDAFAKNADAALTKLRESPVGSNQTLYNQVNQNIQNILGKMAKGETNIDSILSDFDKATKTSQFGSADWGANRYAGDILRKTMYDTADAFGMTGEGGQSLKEMGMNLRNLQNISEAAAKREGAGSGGLLGLPNLLGGDVGIHTAAAIGANPLFGLLLPGSKMALKAVESNPELASVLSKGLSGAGGALTKGAALTEPLAAGATGLAGVIGQTPGNTNQNENNSNEQNNPLAFLGLNNGNNPGQSISQTGTNVNTSAGGSLPATLPNPSELSNTIPGQVFPIDKQQAALQKIQDDSAKYAGNPQGMEYVNQEMQQYQQLKTLNDGIVSQYIGQNGLDENAKDFVRSANPQWQQLQELHQLLQDKGTQNLFSSYLQASPEVQNALAAKDPKYSLMFNLLNQQKLAQARLAQGGVPRQFDLALSTAFKPGQTAAANITNLEFAMKQFLTQYQQYAPLYGLTQQQTTPTAPQPMHPLVQQALGLGQ